MDKYIGFDIDSKKTVACVVQKGERDRYCLRPKAVSLTTFIQLYLADWFVHGIGGSLYEPVTDYVIENYFGVSGMTPKNCTIIN